jgi:GT2 family glycosyltransferase
MRVLNALLRSRRGYLLILATATGVAALLTPSPWSGILGVLSIFGFGSLILILSVRFSDLVARVGRAERDLRRQPVTGVVRRQPSEADERIATRMTSAVDLLETSIRGLEEANLDGVAAAGAGEPWVTVVVPCYNEEQFVATALKSVAGQTFNNWECIVVDDASTDRSLAEIWAIASKDDRFRVLRHQVNSGLGASRNTGLRAARGKYVTFLDADDLLMRDSLIDRVTTLVNAATDPYVIGAYCGVTIGHEEALIEDYPARMEFDAERMIDLVTADGECPFNAHAPLLLTAKVRALGGFDETMRHGAEDWGLWYRAMRNGYVFVPSRFRTAVYRQKRHSMVRSMADAHVHEALRLIKAAHEEVDPSILTAPTPTPLMRPIAEYQAELKMADRAIRFAAMALIAGGEAAAIRSLTTISKVPPALLKRHLGIDDLADRGMQRALGLGPSEFDSFSTLSQPIRDRLTALVESASANFVPEVVEPIEPLAVEALLIPQHAGQTEAMIEAAEAAGVARSDMGVLTTEREGGAQGVAADVPDDLTCWSLNQWALSGGSCRAVVVGEVRTAVVDRIANAVAAGGGQVIVVPQPNSELMSIEEAHRNPIESNGRGALVGVARSVVGLGPGPEGRDVDPASTWVVEEAPRTTFDSLAMAGFRGRHRGERVVIIGNGPSLNELDLTRLKSENTIAVNAIFYAESKMGFDPTYYVVEDTAVMRDNLEAVVAYQAGHKFFPSIYRDMVGEHDDVTYFMMNRGFYEPLSPDFCIPRFSFDPAQRIYSGQSVTIINLQLAYHFGFEEVVLIGMDFSYTVPPEAQVEGDVITSAGPDPNHFHPDYFGAGKVWKDPKLDRVLANYALAKGIFEADGRRIVNATAGGRLELFERVDYTELF